MSTGANLPPSGDPFGACCNWIRPNSPHSPVLQQELVTRNPTETGNLCQVPPESVLPMIHPTWTVSETQAEQTPTTAQSDEWQALSKALQALEIAERNRQDYDQLASELTHLVQTLQAHLPDSKPKRMPYSIENVARAIGEQVAHIKQQQGRSGLDQALRASDNESSIIKCYRMIENIFRQLQIDISLSIWDLTHDQWVDTRLKDLHHVDDARHNAGLPIEMHRRGCTPNTRVKILKEIMDWTQDRNAAKIYWMSGMAGTGKTTIAYTLCEKLEESTQLGASFFCSRASPDCRNVNKIVPTIAEQLARFSNPYQNELCEVLSNNPGVATKNISVQFQKLIVGPLSKVKHAIPTGVIIVIDALDECDDVKGTQLVLELLFRHATSLPVKFFVTSRPEPSISSKINSSDDSYRLILHLHDVEKSLVQEDIRTYLEDELRSVDVKEEDIDRLTVRAGCLFIFAATVVRYIEPHDAAVDHQERLKTVLDAHIQNKSQLYQELDDLYLAILSRALGEVKGNEGNTRRPVLRAVLSAREPLTIPTIVELTGLESERQVQLALLPLQSVLRVSAETRVVSTLHASFLDFMLDPTRSADFHFDMFKQHAYMAARCFAIMERSLRFNICNLETSSQPDQSIPDLQGRVIAAIFPELAYASRYWGSHLREAPFSNGLANMLDDFLRDRLLFWMEVLNLKDWIGSAAAVLFETFNFLQAGDSQMELCRVIQECRNFATTYAASPASQSTPHIYISALPLAPAESFVRRTYWPRTHGFEVGGTAVKDRADAALATWPTGLWVAKLALSKDGKTLASGHSDGSITLWDVSKGRRLLGPLQKHQGTVYSIAFSPDGNRIASGSYDSTIVIWNTHTGDTLISSFHGHTASVTGLLFLIDGMRLISCSEDRTIRIWNSLTGVQIGPELTGHQECVMCIVLSSNGEQLVSCSDDYTIRVWDLNTNTVVGEPLEGHTDWVDCVALSPDDKQIASSSRDCTVRVWSLEHRKSMLDPLLGHTDRVWCVAYSSDGKMIASGSFDQTIRVWSSSTGDLIAGPFQGHVNAVYSVLFSHDGTQIISGSKDGAICTWDASHSISGTNTTAKGHTGPILSIALSPKGTRVASGSADHTICVWDTQDGALLLGPLKGHTGSVRSVAYTPTGACLVSGSEDGTIRTWDASTGLPHADPFTGHVDRVMSVAVSPDGNLVVSASFDGSIMVWRLHNSAEPDSFPTYHTSMINSVAFSPSGSCIASASQDSTLAVVSEVLPDSRKLVTCSEETVSIWDANTGDLLSGPWKGHGTQYWADFSPNGNMIVSGGWDGPVHLWDTKDGTMLETSFRGHTRAVNMVAFTPDNKRIISCSGDRTIRFWDLDSIDNAQNQAFSDLVTQDDGWVKDSESRLVLWLPPDLKDIISFLPCSLVIHPKGLARTDFSNFIYGDRWRECYREPSGSATPDA